MNRNWFQIHLSTAILLMIAGGVLLGLNFFVVRQPQTVWESGLPVFDWSRNAHYDGQLAMHFPGVLPINIALNVAFWLLLGTGFERFIRRREARAK